MGNLPANGHDSDMANVEVSGSSRRQTQATIIPDMMELHLPKPLTPSNSTTELSKSIL
jgi:hypothetical protein